MQGILNYVYGNNYCNCPVLNNTSAYKNQATEWENFDKLAKTHIQASPNPANTWVAFTYCLGSETENGRILIYDISGNTIKTFEISGVQGEIVWDIRDIKPVFTPTH